MRTRVSESPFSFRRWLARRFLTRVVFQPNEFRPEMRWYVERPDWWGCAYSGVTDTSVEAATARLDEWQDEMFAKRRGK